MKKNIMKMGTIGKTDIYLRKKGSNLTAEERAEAEARAAKQHYILKGLPATTWSARMPAYCYTELCPNRKMREALVKKKNR